MHFINLSTFESQVPTPCEQADPWQQFLVNQSERLKQRSLETMDLEEQVIY